jgi:hypothetical protein
LKYIFIVYLFGVTDVVLFSIKLLKLNKFSIG